jgi:hypothetical protein
MVSYRVDRLQDIVNKYRGKWENLTKEEQTELNAALKEIESEQARCGVHAYKDVIGFNQIYRECSYCGKIER